MWQEARKQEKKLRGIMIDFKKRAERRQAYYAKMKTDPHQLMRVYGQKCKLHILTDTSRVVDTDGQLVPWQGDPEVMIDRFDVRSHLDYIPETVQKAREKTDEEEKEERKCSYESYRTLVQIDATGATEEQYLNQLAMEESYGKKMAAINEEKAKSKAKAKIHYEYKDSTKSLNESDDDGMSDSNEEESDGELSDIDINVNVMELNEEQKNHLDALSTQYGIGYGQYCKQLLLEKKEFEYVKRLEEEEEERSKMPGRKGKAARRNLRLKQKSMRGGSPLSFAMEANKDDDDRSSEASSSDSDNGSRSPNEGKIEFITSFGGEDEESKSKPSIADCRKSISKSSDSRRKIKDKEYISHKTSSSRSHRSRSRSRDRKYNSRRRSRDGRHRSRTRSRDGRHKSRSRSRDGRRRSRSRSRNGRRKSRSRSRDRRWKSRSTSRNRTNHRSRSGSRDRKSNSEKNKSSRRRSSSSSSGKSRSRSRSRSRERPSRKQSRSRTPPSKQIAKTLSVSSGNTPVDKSKLSAREKMKLRMAKMLNKQIKQDKKQEEKKQIAKDLEAEERDVQIYEMSKMMKTRERDRKLRRSPSPRGRMESYDASKFHYRPRSRSPV